MWYNTEVEAPLSLRMLKAVRHGVARYDCTKADKEKKSFVIEGKEMKFFHPFPGCTDRYKRLFLRKVNPVNSASRCIINHHH